MCSPRKSDENFSILTCLWIKTNVAYTRLEVITKQHSALQVYFITSVKLICYFVLYYCFLHWAHPPNMAVGDLAFYYTPYLWSHQAIQASLSFQNGRSINRVDTKPLTMRWKLYFYRNVFCQENFVNQEMNLGFSLNRRWRKAINWVMILKHIHLGHLYLRNWEIDWRRYPSKVIVMYLC